MKPNLNAQEIEAIQEITNDLHFVEAELFHINTEEEIAGQLYNDAQEMIDSAENISKYPNITIVTVMNNNDTPTVYVINNNLI